MLSTIQKKRNEEGFTLIELLVVVIIIGILAAIAIPVFLNQRESAWRSAAESDARNAAIVVETYFTTNNDYPADDATFEAMSGLQKSDAVALTYTKTAGGYTIEAYHDNIGAGATLVATYDSSAGGLQ